MLTDRPDYPKAQDRLADVLFAWGDQLAKSGNNEGAVLRYREAAVFWVDDVELHTSLGAALARLGRAAEGRTELETAIRLNPKFGPAQKILAAISH